MTLHNLLFLHSTLSKSKFFKPLVRDSDSTYIFDAFFKLKRKSVFYKVYNRGQLDQKCNSSTMTLSNMLKDLVLLFGKNFLLITDIDH